MGFSKKKPSETTSPMNFDARQPKPTKQIFSGAVNVMPVAIPRNLDSDQPGSSKQPTASPHTITVAQPRQQQFGVPKQKPTPILATTATQSNQRQSVSKRQAMNSSGVVKPRPQSSVFKQQEILASDIESQSSGTPGASSPQVKTSIDDYTDVLDSSGDSDSDVYTSDFSGGSENSSGEISKEPDDDADADILKVSDSQQGPSGDDTTSATFANIRPTVPSMLATVAQPPASRKNSISKTFAPSEKPERLENVYQSLERIQNTIQEHISNGSAQQLQPTAASSKGL